MHALKLPYELRADNDCNMDFEEDSIDTSDFILTIACSQSSPQFDLYNEKSVHKY